MYTHTRTCCLAIDREKSFSQVTRDEFYGRKKFLLLDMIKKEYEN